MDEKKDDEIVYDDDYIIKKGKDKQEKLDEKDKKEEKPKKAKKSKTKTKKKTTKKEEKKDRSMTYIAILAIILIVAILFKTGKIGLPGQSTPDESGIAAVVNGQEITNEEIEKIYQRVPENLKVFYTKERLVEQEIINTLLVQKAKDAGLRISDNEIDAALAELKVNFGGEENFQQALEQYGMTEEEIAEEIERDLLIKEYLSEDVIGEIEISDQDVEEYYVANLDQFKSPEIITASHILICFDEIATCEVDRTREEAFALFKELVQKLDDGADFAELAKEYSDGPSAPEGGSLGTFPKGTMVETFENQAFALEPGEYNRVATETRFGFHLIYVTDKQEEGIYPLDEIKTQIVQQMRAEQEGEVVEQYVESLKEGADIINYYEQSCYEGYGLSSDTVLFVTSDEDWCEYCEEMSDIVKNVDADFKEVDYERSEILEECYSDAKDKGAPQFICAGTGESIVGTTTESKLKEFADSCA